MARVLLLALMVGVWASTEAAASSLGLDSSKGCARSGCQADQESTSKEQICPSPFTKVGNGCYFFQEVTYMSWDDARAYCQALGPNVDLAVVDDCAQFGLLWNFILETDGTRWAWVGGRDTHSNGTWEWVTGAPMQMGTPFWAPSRPDADEYDKCVALSSPAGYFTNFSCPVLSKFVCQVQY